MYQQPYSQQPYLQQPRRSAIPKVIGILMIIFGSLGVAAALFGFAMSGVSSGDERLLRDEMPQFYAAVKQYEKLELIISLVGLPISVLQLVGGIFCLKYKSSAPKLALTYASLSGLHTIIKGVVLFGFAKPAIEAAGREAGAIGREAAELMNFALGIGLVLGTVFALAWPIIVLILMTRPGAKAACVN